MTSPQVAILDYGSGNIRSAQRAIEKAGARVFVIEDPESAANFDGLIIPGVGAFSHCMSRITEIGATNLLAKQIIANRPVLGICVGMQMLFSSGIEGGIETAGLSRWPGKVEKIRADRIPHMGWNTVQANSDSILFQGLSESYFYFVHSYAVKEMELSDESKPKPLISYSQHGERFIAAIEDGPLTAVQFHPEKSGANGIKFIQNWLTTI